MDEMIYCRFCAQCKSADKLLNLDNDQIKYSEILTKLSFLNAIYVNVSSRDNLPRNVCLVCYESLNTAFDFLTNVKKAQEVLSTLFDYKDPDSSRFHSDDDTEAYNDFLPVDTTETTPLVKNEHSPYNIKDIVAPNLDVSVKVELKDESDPSSILQDAIDSLQNGPNENYEQVNVQDILDVALNNVPFNPELEIFSRELPGGKKKILTWKEYRWVCVYCNMEFLDVDMLRSHSKVAHGKCAAFSCCECKLFKKTDFQAFLKHIRKHWKSLRNKCHYCNEIVKDDLTIHFQQHVPENHIQCPNCGEVFTEELLKQHLLDFISVKQKRKPRRKAGTPITTEDLTCHICKKLYKNPNSLRDHIKRHKSDRKKNFTCDRCGKTFYNKGTLSSHIMVHDEIRPHICKICNKSFIFPNMLRRHVEMHTGVKPFSCEQCGRCFRLQYQLNNHKIIHTNSMPYICQYCNKAFRFKQILKNHERQHTGAKPYCCQHCGMEFSNWSNYNKHTKRRHNIDTSKKKITPDGVFPINPETGQMMQMNVQGVEEWKSRIMIPGKRGKKKVIKVENENV